MKNRLPPSESTHLRGSTNFQAIAYPAAHSLLAEK